MELKVYSNGAFRILTYVFRAIFYRNVIEAGKCDISTWYTKVSAEGLFDSSMNTQQKKIHSTIQNLVVHSKNKLNVKLIDCKILEIYENEMKKGKVVKATEPKPTTEKSQTDDNLTTIKTTENTSSQKNDSNKLKNPLYEKLAELKSDDEATEKMSREKDRESEMLADDSEIDETELDEIKDERSSDGDLDDSENHKDIQYKKFETRSDDRTRKSLVQEEMLKQETNTSDSEKIETESNGLSNTNGSLYMRNNKEITKYIATEGKTCKRYTWKLQKYMVLNISPKEVVDESNKKNLGYDCGESYTLSPSYCSLQIKDTIMYNMTKHITGKFEKRTDYLTDNSHTPLTPGSTNRYTKEILEAGTEKENANEINELSTEHEAMLIDQTLNEEIDNSFDELLIPNESYSENSEDMIMSHNNEDLPNDTIQRSSNEETSNEYKSQETFDIKVLEDIVSLKTEEYTKKITVLELNIIKLENQMLMEKLNKENHSSTIARLENSILRLENELLRMKQSFHHMKIENDEMKRAQRKYLELGHSSESYSLQKRNQDQLLTEQQQTIMKLSENLQNQSYLIDKLKNRSEDINDQNRMLHAMVMNQTVLMSQIMAKVQSLTERTLQQHEATEEMKLKLRIGLEDVKVLKNSQTNQQLVDPPATNPKESYLEDLSNQLLQQLDDLVSDKKLESGETIEHASSVRQIKDQDDEVDEQLKEYLHYNSITSSVKPQEWCNSSAHCYKGFIIISECVPFSSLVFANCETESLMKYSETDNEPESIENIQRNEKKSNERKESETSQNVQLPDPDDRTSVKKEENIRLSMDQYNETTEGDVLKFIEKAIEEIDVKQTLTTKNVQNKEKDTATEQEIQKPMNNLESDLGKENEEDMNKMKTELHRNSIVKNPSADTGRRNESDISGSDTKENNEHSTGDKTKAQELENLKNKEISNKSTNIENRKHESDIASIKESKTPVKYVADGQSDPKDCYDYYVKGNSRNGVYKIRPYGTNRLIQVYCDMKKGGWTLIQKRQDGTTNFYRDWEDYREGFGGVYGEHWLGNNVIHRLTNQDHYTLRIEMTDWDKNSKFAEYSTFVVDDEDDGYKLHIGGYEGDAGDGMIKHNNKKFSTRDVDNDQVVKEFGGSCAKRFHAAWWFYKCYQSNLNGKYYRNGKIDDKKYDGVTWKPWKGTNYSLKYVEMKIKPN
ncbi:uncharacterized protein LOC133182618 [Saccostrea echinata]|uniref:uncharacterized protein LOC133182618 n=1 Tax=Saccostrea echinata TaxID=191078 RepID=UPI002A824517|nr:uncharacterized protein LOC133182618 [Saccostrea echinata]